MLFWGEERGGGAAILSTGGGVQGDREIMKVRQSCLKNSQATLKEKYFGQNHDVLRQAKYLPPVNKEGKRVTNSDLSKEERYLLPSEVHFGVSNETYCDLNEQEC